MAVSDYDPIFEDAGRSWNVDPILLKAIMQQESGGNPNATSSAGARGLMQIIDPTGRALGLTNPYDPAQSIFGAAKLMSQLLDRYGSPEKALVAYSGGARNYVPSVTAHYVALQRSQGAGTSGASGGGSTPAPAPKPPVTPTSQRNDEPDPLSRLAPEQPSTPAPAPPAPAAQPSDPLSRLAPEQAPEAPTTPIDTTIAPGISTPEGYFETAPGYTPPPSAAAVPVPQGGAMPMIPNALVPVVEKAAEGWQAGRYGVVGKDYEGSEWGPTRGLNTVAQILGALNSGGLEAVNQMFGRDAAAFAEWWLNTGGEGAMPHSPMPGRAVAPWEYLSTAPERPIGGPNLNASPWAPENILQGEPPGGAAGAANPLNRPAPSTAAGAGPQPVGAQVTPHYEPLFTPQEEAAYRATAEGTKLTEGQIIGERDTNQYIPGSNPNLAEIEQTATTARDLKALNIASPEASDAAKAAAQNNNNARVAYLENTTKTRNDLNILNAKREDAIETDKKAVFAPENVTGSIDKQPIIDHMQEVLSRKINQENTPLKTIYQPLLERIQKADLSDPEAAWSLRQDIDRMTDKRAQAANDPEGRNLHYVARQLSDVSDVIDKQIEAVAPGYSDMVARYKEFSRQMAELRVLQDARAGLTRGSQQIMYYSDFQRFMKNVVDSRSTPARDINDYKAISPETMKRLWNLRDDLRRSASSLDLAKAAGSDTTPNIIDALRVVAQHGGNLALNAAATHLFGPVGGPLAAAGLKGVTRPYFARRGAKKIMRSMQNMLAPDIPLRTPPGQENPLAPP